MKLFTIIIIILISIKFYGIEKMSFEMKILISIVLATIFLTIFIIALIALSKETSLEAIKEIFIKIIPKWNYLIIVK
jgi:hypothetical protein